MHAAPRRRRPGSAPRACWQHVRLARTDHGRRRHTAAARPARHGRAEAHAAAAGGDGARRAAPASADRRPGRARRGGPPARTRLGGRHHARAPAGPAGAGAPARLAAAEPAAASARGPLRGGGVARGDGPVRAHPERVLRGAARGSERAQPAQPGLLGRAVARRASAAGWRGCASRTAPPRCGSSSGACCRSPTASCACPRPTPTPSSPPAGARCWRPTASTTSSF